MAVDRFRLIEEVRKRPLLWDFQHAAVQRNSKKSEALWAEIEELLDVDATICKQTWVKLRANFCNETKRIPIRIAQAKKAGSYSHNKKYYCWAYFDSLKFLSTGLSSRAMCHKSFGNDFDSDDIEIVDSDNIDNASDSNSFQTESDNDIEIAEGDNDMEVENDDLDEKPCLKENNFENEFLPKKTDSTSPTAPIPDSPKAEPESKKFKAYTVSINSCVQDVDSAASAVKSDTVIKEEPEFKIKTEKDPFKDEDIDEFQDCTSSVVSAAKLNYGFANSNLTMAPKENEDNDLEEFISSKPCANDKESEHHNPPSFPEDQVSCLPNLNDEDYGFLYSFISQSKVMTPLQKMDFRVNMQKLLASIFPASASVNILEKQLLLPEDNDPDRKFLISFWPFMKSMSPYQNLQFRLKMTGLLYNTLATETNQ